MMKITHSEDIAFRRPRVSAILERRQFCTCRERRSRSNLPCAEKSTDQRTDGQECDDEAFTTDRKVAGADVGTVFALGETLEKVVHEEDIGDLSGIVLHTQG